jgi:hypothetical protein
LSSDAAETFPTVPLEPVSHVVMTVSVPTKSAETTRNVNSEEVLTVGDVLAKLGLHDYQQQFEQEQIDLETLMICEDTDLKGMGLPLGPRKKLLTFLGDHKLKQHSSAQVTETVHQPTQEVDRGVFPAAADNNGSSEDSSPRTPRGLDRRDPLLRSASNTSVDYIVSSGGTGVPLVRYPQLNFQPCHFFALGSPISMFLTVRGVDCLGQDFHLPTCAGFYNIFHPFDPVAYRVEPMVISGCPVKPVLIPHHKGRKRLHLELRENLSRVGSDLKQKIIESFRSTWKTINDLAHYGWSTADASSAAADVEPSEAEIDSIVRDATSYYEDSAAASSGSQATIDEEYPIGKLNRGRRVDYVLQEKPIESFNDYLFALSSHACYWESEDTALLMLKEIYALMGVAPVKSGTDVVAQSAPAQQPGSIHHPAFPRHPLAVVRGSPGIPFPSTPNSLTSPSSSASRPVPGGSALPAPAISLYNQPLTAASGVGPLPPPVSGSPYLGGPPPPATDAPSPFAGPPPKSGFVRK